MRIALYHHLPPGGALRSVTEVVKHLPAGVECDVYTLSSSRWWPVTGQAATVPVPVHQHDLHLAGWAEVAGGRFRHEALVGAVRRAEREVAELINDGGYDAVLVHPCWVTQTPQIVFHLLAPVIYYMHEPRRSTFEARYRQQGGTQPFRSKVVTSARERRLVRADRQVASRLTTVLCNSYYSRESIKRAYGIEATVAYLGVDTDVFGPAGPEARESAVLVVGGLEPFKRQDFVVRALAELPAEQRPDLRMVYERADPAYRSRVLGVAADLGVTVTEHHGVDDVTLAELYRTSRATVLAADLEPFGLSMIESLACGTPVVAVREGGYREVVRDGVNGYLVERSETALARAVESLADPEAVRDPATLRASILPFWTWPEAAERQMDVVRSVVRGRAP